MIRVRKLIGHPADGASLQLSISGISGVTIATRDLGRSIDFYARVFGFRVAREGGGWWTTSQACARRYGTSASKSPTTTAQRTRRWPKVRSLRIRELDGNEIRLVEDWREHPRAPLRARCPVLAATDVLPGP